MAKVGIRSVIKDYGKTRIIHGIDMQIDDGEFVVIVGPSGCGKSTLLRMVAGLERISDGEVSINERVVNNAEPKDRDIAMVFQNYALYPHMSVFDNMAYGLKLKKISKSNIRRRVDEAAELLQLTDLLQRKPRQLSGGQRQRVAMGRAIVREPAVFLFDEPLSNLDAKLRVQMRLEIKQLQRRLNVTSLYVTHDQIEAMTMADRLLVMNAGRAEQIGAPMDVYRHPATRFVAGFIGSPAMNFLDARVTATGPRLADGQVLAVAAPPGADDTRITVGIRPEHIELNEQPGSNPLKIWVEMVEPLGAESLLHGNVGESPITVKSHDPLHAAAQGELTAWIPPDALHYFDPASGVRLAGGAGG